MNGKLQKGSRELGTEFRHGLRHARQGTGPTPLECGLAIQTEGTACSTIDPSVLLIESRVRHERVHLVGSSTASNATAYAPVQWRGWWDFGTGALGDIGCHIIDHPVWTLKLGAPDFVEAHTTIDGSFALDDKPNVETPEIRRELFASGHHLATRCDTEAWVHVGHSPFACWK